MAHVRISWILIALLAIGTRVSAQTMCPFPGPSIVEPADGAKSVATPVTFTWTSADGALDYEVWASYDGVDFERLETTRETRLFDDVPPATSVEWYVVANFATCALRSASATFTTGDCNPPAAELIAPIDGSLSGSPVTFAWSEVEEADGYRLWIDARVALETRGNEAHAHLAPGTHRWFVESFFDDCGSRLSGMRVVEVARASGCPQAKATLIAPTDGSTIASRDVAFSWNPVPGAIEYEVRAALGDGTLEFIGETTATSTTARLSDGRITWVVVARFNGCDDTVSATSHFTIPYDPDCDNGTPFPIAPANDADNVPTRVDFLWTAVARAKSYNVYVYPDEGDGDAILVGSTTSTRLSSARARRERDHRPRSRIEMRCSWKKTIAMRSTIWPGCSSSNGGSTKRRRSRAAPRNRTYRIAPSPSTRWRRSSRHENRQRPPHRQRRSLASSPSTRDRRSRIGRLTHG